ncbi:MAG TPA: hypothetical protein VKB09_15330 [Thermomicrobiales bacterium]|nr:hypothetical protein [Thermomicrobiales bacterium]
MRSERDKWRVPESDPAGQQPATGRGFDRLPRPHEAQTEQGDEPERAPLIYCGQCGALNPATNHFCAACGATLLDAFHASEGLRVYERPDTASRLIEIVPAGNELDVVEDPDAPMEFARVKLATGRLGYIRLADVEALAATAPTERPRLDAPDINTRARGCVTSTAALASLALLIVISTFGYYLLVSEDVAEGGFLALIFCVVLAPLLLLTIGIYLYARNREERLEIEEEDAANSPTQSVADG